MKHFKKITSLVLAVSLLAGFSPIRVDAKSKTAIGSIDVSSSGPAYMLNYSSNDNSTVSFKDMIDVNTSYGKTVEFATTSGIASKHKMIIIPQSPQLTFSYNLDRLGLCTLQQGALGHMKETYTTDKAVQGLYNSSSQKVYKFEDRTGQFYLLRLAIALSYNNGGSAIPDALNRKESPTVTLKSALDSLLTSSYYGSTYFDVSTIKDTSLKREDVKSFAQSVSDYATANGITLDGKISEFCTTVQNMEQKLQQENKENASSGLTVSDAGTYDDWANAMALNALGQNYPDKYNANNLFSSNLTDAQKAQLACLPYQWTELGTDVNGTKVPKEDLANYAKLNILENFERANASYGNFPEAATQLTNVENELNEIASNADNTLDSTHRVRMLTFCDRVKFWAYNANLAGGSQHPMPNSINAYYFDSDTTSGDSSGISMYLSSKTNKISFAPAESNGMFQVHDVDSYIRLYETCVEMEAYARESADVINEAIKDGSDASIKNWAKALTSVSKGLEFLNSNELNAIWKNSSLSECGKSLEKLYEEIKNSTGNLEDIGSLNATLEIGRPLNMFMDLDNNTMSNYILQGISYSTQYIPMRTNVYSQYTVAQYDTEFLSDFHYKYGFNRKALFIDESSDSAMQYHNTNTKGTLRVCTLKDLVNCVGDKTLYLDDNFYNADDLAKLLVESYDKVKDGDVYVKEDDTEEEEDKSSASKWWSKITENLTESFNLDFESQLKTGENTEYSSPLRNMVAAFKDSGYVPDAEMKDSSNSAEEEDDRSDDNKDNIVMTSGQINEYLNMETVTRNLENPDDADAKITGYNVLQGYAVVSSIYRDQGLFNLANSSQLQQPVFIASKDVPEEQNATQYERNEIFNWMLLKNLKSQMPVGYETSLDMNCPVYMDIYGNILTESGVVVVPAAANATLYDGEYYDNIYNIALPYIYGGDWQMEVDEDSFVDGTLVSAFEEDYDLGNWKVRSRVIDGGVVDFARLSVASADTRETITKAFNSFLVKDHYIYNKFVNIALEVMRGAPIEYIDKEAEGINPTNINKAGLLSAAKLEALNEALDMKGENTILSIPNIAFVSGVEYIALFAFKIMMFVTILVMMITLYTDIVSQHLSWRTPIKCLGFIVLTVLSIVTIPTVFDISYYESNRALLQGETEYIAMLNEEKRQSGVEIGVYELHEPDISSELYVKLDDIYVPWYDLFSDIMLSSTYNNIEEIYDSYADDSPIARQPDVTIMNDGVYISINDLFDSATIDMDSETKQLTLSTDKITTAAFYMPYYTILEALVNDVNEFNETNNWNGYTENLSKGGRLKSTGAIEGYFTDVAFMENQGDILHMEEVYRIPSSVVTENIFTEDDVTLMSKSAWYNSLPTVTAMEQRFGILSEDAKKFIAENRGIIGTISDETFLKVMALHLAIEHNNIFGINSCNAIEIKNLSVDDTMRLMTGTRSQVMYDSTLSYPRYIYEIGGSVAVYLSALLSGINFIAGYLKPLCTALIMIVIYISLFVFKVCLHKKTSSVWGYAVTTIELCVLNIVYAICIKLSMYFPTLGINPSICIILDIVIQVVYLFCLLKVTYLSFKDWQDLGYARYRYQMSKMEVGANELTSIFKQKFHFFGKKNKGVADNTPARRFNTERPEDNWAYYDSLTESRKNRKKKYHIG